MIRIDRIDTLVDALERGKAANDDEAVDLLSHSLQCAANLERAAPDDLELQVAGLVHDLGTILEPGRPRSHARTGGDAVRGLLGPRIAELVTRHDEAKRYLVAVDPGYLDHLSPQSAATLELQGGPLTEPERLAFERRRDADACVMLRRADDDAKIAGLNVPPLEHWHDALLECARQSGDASDH